MFLKASFYFWMYQIFIVLGKTCSPCVRLSPFRCEIPRMPNDTRCAYFHKHMKIHNKFLIHSHITEKCTSRRFEPEGDAHTLACTFECKNTRNTSNRKPKSSYGDIIHPLFVSHPLTNTKETHTLCADEATKQPNQSVSGEGSDAHLNDRKHLGKKLFKSLNEKSAL